MESGLAGSVTNWPAEDDRGSTGTSKPGKLTLKPSFIISTIISTL
jgi:hypothetical protein